MYEVFSDLFSKLYVTSEVVFKHRKCLITLICHYQKQPHLLHVNILAAHS